MIFYLGKVIYYGFDIMIEILFFIRKILKLRKKIWKCDKFKYEKIMIRMIIYILNLKLVNINMVIKLIFLFMK